MVAECYPFVTVLSFFGDFFDFLRMLVYTDSELSEESTG